MDTSPMHAVRHDVQAILRQLLWTLLSQQSVSPSFHVQPPHSQIILDIVDLFCILSCLRDVLNLRCGCHGCCGGLLWQQKPLLLLRLRLWLKLRLRLQRPWLL